MRVMARYMELMMGKGTQNTARQSIQKIGSARSVEGIILVLRTDRGQTPIVALKPDQLHIPVASMAKTLC
ncbi:hypothetical protein AUK40_03650 [Candidatus Wirthbacteria bacterium CG2_30_54_11]|uniref:Uncharacterized protein n=1 Tax=Candidatus Wirthbacteria bacterium CG2_30_54_11 TaxID=1817892 RepID=A0A1J5IKH9_9BACT|nr:MAG: hypothetical protein AUK40_03650 [Candidatus Wirthbacteria bacterium CG2_30_54_11]